MVSRKTAFIAAAVVAAVIAAVVAAVVISRVSARGCGCKLVLGESRLGGRGVFANAAIRRGEVLERCPYLKVKPDTAGIKDYVFEHGDGKHHVLVLGFGGMYNHSKNPNAEYRDDGKDMVYSATRDIPRGAEITISYGSDWWDTRTKSMIT